MAIIIKNKQKILPIRKETVRKIAEKILSDYGVYRYEICIEFFDNFCISELNKKYLNHACPTDVLTFLYSEPERKAGEVLSADIAISAEMAMENSHFYKTPIKRELCLYIIHALLHALGFDDRSTYKKYKMRKAEKYWLKILKNKIKEL